MTAGKSWQRGLRFDKVALGLIARLQTTLREQVPEGKTILVTISAPIRLPAKTAVAMDERIRRWLAGPSKPAELRATINGNQIRVRLVTGASNRSSNVLVFVHNPEVDTAALFDNATLQDRRPNMVKGLAFTAYPSNDVAGTRRWYEEQLGLEFAGPYVEDGIEKYNEAHLGTGCFSLMAAEWTSRAAGSASSAYFEVDNVDELVASLQANGVTIDDRFEGPVCKQASFCDPEGNRLTIHESTTQRS